MNIHSGVNAAVNFNGKVKNYQDKTPTTIPLTQDQEIGKEMSDYLLTKVGPKETISVTNFEDGAVLTFRMAREAFNKIMGSISNGRYKDTSEKKEPAMATLSSRAGHVEFFYVYDSKTAQDAQPEDKSRQGVFQWSVKESEKGCMNMKEYPTFLKIRKSLLETIKQMGQRKSESKN